MQPSPDDSGVVPIGSVLDGRYRVDSILGTGGMGRVYKGEHTGIGRAVAIKILHADLGRNKEATQRFQREALASGRLDHPNIVGVTDFGVLDDGCLYLVMEALEGEGLGTRLERDNRIPWLEATEIIRGVLAGLRHAHDRNVIHRDIKPDNIVLARKDGEQIVKILDFGIAKLLAGTGDDPATTRAGLTVGTPAYLSPEQAVGGEIKAATDLYSTSVVFYEMLAGRPPFEDTDPLAIMTAHVSREPPIFKEIAPDLKLPAGLERLILRGLEKVSAERTGSATDYMAQLDDVLRAAGYDVASPAPRTSGQVRIPTPPPGALKAAPFSAAPTVAFTPMPFDATRSSKVVSIADVSEPLPRKWLVIGGLVLIAAIIGAIALKVSGGKHADPPAKHDPPPKHAEASPPSPPPQPPHEDPPAAVAPIAAAPESTPAPPAEATVDRDAAYKAAVHELQTGKTCTDRKAALARLVDLDDPRALAPIKQARYRPHGGVLGIGERNANACLHADADAAIKKLDARK